MFSSDPFLARASDSSLCPQALNTRTRLALREFGRINLQSGGLPDRASRLGASTPFQPSLVDGLACRACQDVAIDNQSRQNCRHGRPVLSKTADARSNGRAESPQGIGPSGRQHSLPHEVTLSFRNGHAAARPAQARAAAATSAADSREGTAGRQGQAQQGLDARAQHGGAAGGAAAAVP